MSDWQDLERPGYLGKQRDQQFFEWDRKFGELNWRLVWAIGDYRFEVEAAIALYEDAYYRFLEQNPAVLDQLTREANDVYDDNISNVECGLKYFPQETNRTHLQDVAIRRCLVRLGCWFEGGQLIQIRDHLSGHPLGMTLSPGQVPFHRPDLIVEPQLAGWWLPGSVESFYQSNRWLQVR